MNRATSAPGPVFNQIGSDGGYLAEPVVLNQPGDPLSPRLVMAPGERADVIIDFSAYAPGTEFILRNTAKAPYPAGEAPDGQTTGQVMLFRVVAATSPDASVIPAQLATVTRLGNPSVHRTMTLNEIAGQTGPLMAMLNGMHMDAPATELPTLGTTEMWEVVNLTGDAHPIHLHLVQFQLLNRQKVDIRRYQKAYEAVNVMDGESYTPVDVAPYLRGKPTPADANERGWKDTYRMNPGEVTRVLIRFAPQDESPAFAFDATAEPGYVWHCHILEHEENDMMRPYHLVAAAPVAQQIQTAAPSADLNTGAISGSTRLLSLEPNPSSNGNTIRFSLRSSGMVQVALYSVTGQRVRQLASGSFAAGDHSLRWDGTDEAGRTVASGVYFVKLDADGRSSTRKVFVTP
jgi:FtsP/CotA-like multicopper oxidase with cupredoxin domain